MTKYIILAVSIIAFIGTVSAQKLSFRKDGTFKIIQFTDTHICAENSESQNSLKTIAKTLENEHPDLIIFSGDVVTGKPARPGWNMVLEPVSKTGIPFCVVLGNHDDEQDISREEIARIVTSYSGNLNVIKDGCLDDFVLTIDGAKSAQTEALVYCMDSHAYSKIDTVKGYGWFTFDQIAWYRKKSKEFTQQNGGRPYPALGFFHIPLPEYKKAFENKKGRVVGHRLEDECSPELNSGMFSAFLECGDVMGTFVGHDHNNDYAASLYGITLCYGRFTGSKTTYTDIPNGSRIIELREGDHGFSTWIRKEGEAILNPCYWNNEQSKVRYEAFSHNDYMNKHPLIDALNYGYNNVEADIHLIDGKLFVAHDFPKDTIGLKTFEEAYLKPIAERIAGNEGKMYTGGKGPFYLMVDFKSDGEKTYKALQPIIEKYKDILCSVENGEYKERAVLLFFSGNRPLKSLPKQGIRYAFIDGRISDVNKNIPALVMPVVSNNFYDYFSRDSKSGFSGADLEKLRTLVAQVHKEGKKLRFWGVPDTNQFKVEMMREGVDFIGTDNLEKLVSFLENQKINDK